MSTRYEIALIIRRPGGGEEEARYRLPLWTLSKGRKACTTAANRPGTDIRARIRVVLAERQRGDACLWSAVRQAFVAFDGSWEIRATGRTYREAQRALIPVLPPLEEASS